MDQMIKTAGWLAFSACLFIASCDQFPTDIEQTPQLQPTNSYPSATRIYFTAGGQELPSNNPGTIERVNPDGTGLTTILALPAGARPTGLAIDQPNGHLYWNDWNFRNTQRVNLDGTGTTLIQTHPSGNPGRGTLNLALDVPGNKIYVTSGAFFRRVSRFNLDGTGAFQVLVTNAFFPDGIALDLSAGHVYYGDPGISPTGIHRMNLDGTGDVTLLSPTAFPSTNGCSGDPRHGRGRGMALDLANSKMYFAGHPRLPDLFTCPAGLGEIWSANLDGSGLTLLVTGLEKPDGIALDLGAGKMYWTDGRAGKVQRANLDGSNVQDVVTGIPTPRALVLESFINVDIDIKPGSDPNSINCDNGSEVIAVAILTTDSFDAPTVDHTTVTFEGATESHVDRRTGAARRHEEDVDGDGDIDLVLHFRLGDTGLTCDSTDGTLTGQTFSGDTVEGQDAVRMIDN